MEPLELRYTHGMKELELMKLKLELNSCFVSAGVITGMDKKYHYLRAPFGDFQSLSTGHGSSNTVHQSKIKYTKFDCVITTKFKPSQVAFLHSDRSAHVVEALVEFTSSKKISQEPQHDGMIIIIQESPLPSFECVSLM